MAKSKRFEVWAFAANADGAHEWQLAGSYADLAGADGFVRQSLKGTAGVRTARIVDSTDELKPREYNCAAPKAA